MVGRHLAVGAVIFWLSLAACSGVIALDSTTDPGSMSDAGTRRPSLQDLLLVPTNRGP